MTAIDTGAARRMRLAAARLYLVCPAMTGPGGRDASGLPDLLRGAIAGGVDVVQLREKELPDDELVGIADGVVTIRLFGACDGCPMSPVTLRAGVERIIREEVPGVRRVVAVG